MKINRLQLKNYRNYSNLDIELSPNLNIFIGKNAQGKSNILESIFVLALTKSYMNVKDYNLIKNGQDFTNIKASFSNLKQNDMLNIVITANSKKIKINSNEIKKYSDYISKVKVLIFSPYNVNFVKDGPMIRRKSINIVLSQFSNHYVRLLQNYNALLKKRNHFLKSIDCFKEYNRFYFDALNDKFCTFAVDIVLERKQFISKVNQVLSRIYFEITGDQGLFLDYVSNVEINEDRVEIVAKLQEQLKLNFDREKNYGATFIGPHRDDFLFFLNEKDLSIYGSQGQIRAAILSLKLAELLIFKEKDGDYPILLLDDVFSELDVEKRNRLVKYILDDVQTIITTTDIDMLDSTLIDKARVFKVSDGMIVEKKEGMQNE